MKPSMKKGSNRHSLDIVSDMLSAASVKARKTRIMYQANLSFTQVEKYLHSLLENGLLCHDGDSCYSVTQKGLEFLRLYSEYVEHCKQIEDRVGQSAREKLLLEGMCALGRDFNGGFKVTRKATFPEM